MKEDEVKKLEIGTRVRLIPTEEAGEEFGVYNGWDRKSAYVTLDIEYRMSRKDFYDDGLREVSFDEMELEEEEKTNDTE